MNPLHSTLRRAVLGALATTAALASPARAQEAAPIGVNLDAVLYYSPEIPFVDVFKTAMPWIPQLAAPGGPWNTGAPLALTPEGWPLLAPGQAAATLMLNDFGGKFPTGQYTLLYEGTGQIEFGSNVVVTSSQPGKKTLDVYPSNGGILLRVVASDPADPVRDIHLLLPGFDETNHEQQLFNPTFLERLEPYDFVRFMMWQNVNHSNLAHWADRPTPDDAMQTGPHGVALEYMVELANRTGKSPWFCVPHAGSDDFMTQFATYLRDHLDPAIPAYIELSNEVWATNYEGGKYAQLQGLQQSLSPDPYIAQLNWYSKRSLEMFALFENVFGAQMGSRVVRVLAGQAGWVGPAQNILAYMDAGHHADAFAIAPYFGGNLGGPSMWQETQFWTLDQFFAEFETQILGKVTDFIVQHRDLCAQYDLPLLCYEAGQRVAAEGPGLTSPTLIQKIIDVNRDPRMYDAYWLYLERWTELVGPQPIALFVSCRTSSQWGAYGILEFQHQPASEAPKYRALADWTKAADMVSHFGAACGGVESSYQGAPALGSPDFTLRVDGAAPGAPAWLILGVSNQMFGALPLPAFLAPLAPGCALQVSVEAALATLADADGRAEVAFAVPDDPALDGLRLFTQWAVAAPLENPLGLVFASPIGFQIGE